MNSHKMLNNSNKYNEKIINIFISWLMNKSTRQISQEAKESEEYVKTTIDMITNKINTFEKSTKLLEEMGIISAIAPPNIS